MAALTAGTLAPDFWLEDLKGDRHRLGDWLKKGPVLLFFYKTSCPTCQLMAPFVETLHRALGDLVQLIGVAEDPPDQVRAFTVFHALTFVQLCEEQPYPVSSRFGLSNVPTTFLVGADGVIQATLVGWDRDKFNQLATLMAGWAGVEPFEVAGADAPLFKAG